MEGQQTQGECFRCCKGYFDAMKFRSSPSK